MMEEEVWQKEEVGQKADHWNQLCCCITGSGYAGVGYYFHDHFYPGTVINETNFFPGNGRGGRSED